MRAGISFSVPTEFLVAEAGTAAEAAVDADGDGD